MDIVLKMGCLSTLVKLYNVLLFYQNVFHCATFILQGEGGKCTKDKEMHMLPLSTM